jgi:formylmethanofuran dehydrogenase subunit E
MCVIGIPINTYTYQYGVMQLICSFCGEYTDGTTGVKAVPICAACYEKLGEDKYDNIVLERGL